MSKEAEPVWICQPDGSEFTEHRVFNTDLSTTICGITYESLPAIDGNPEDKNWFGDHDRDDVVLCEKGCFS